MPGIFDPALQAMAENENDSFGPESFQKYMQRHALPRRNTAAMISVDSLCSLAPELIQNAAMVFRLGRFQQTPHTAFALCRRRTTWADFFLEDRALFGELSPKPFTRSGMSRDLAAFRYLPRLTEPSVVNLAICSGLLHAALGLDEAERLTVPATGQSTYTFDVRPYADAPVWHHLNGQVEIDSLFFASRQRTETLFLVEAKCSAGFDSLAKHKLVYPYLALRQTIPPPTPIVPVYLRVVRNTDGWTFYVCECELKNADLSAISQLVPTTRVHALQLRL